MTNKKQQLLEAGLALFASEGYAATSTNKIAATASVSEGLIFRHFGNKEGLVNEILKMGEARTAELYAPILRETDPHIVIQKALTLPLSVPESDYPFWRLQYKLKWELGNYNAQKLAPLKAALLKAFKTLQHAQPAQEAEYVLISIDGLATRLLFGELKNKQAMKKFLLAKHNAST